MAKNTIKVTNYSDVMVEHTASEAITPGMFLTITSDLEVSQRDASTNDLVLVAVEDELQGNGITDDYADGDPVQCWVPYRGDIVYGIVADGTSVTVGDKVIINTKGKVKTLGSAGGTVIGIALESLDLTASANTADGNIEIRIV